MSYPSASSDQPVTPPEKSESSSFVDHMDFKNRLEEGRQQLGPWVKEQSVDYKFWSLEQWEAGTKQALAEEGRPALTFDRTRPIIQAVLGSQITQRFNAVYLPRETSLNQPDMKLAESGSRIAKYIQGRGNFEQIESLAFQDTLVTGIGCIEMFSSFEEEPDGQIRIARVPAGSYMWDPASTEPAMLDARWVIRARWVDRKAAADLYGYGRVAGASDEDYPLRDVVTVHQSNPAWSLFGESDTPNYDRTRDQVMLYEYQCFERVYKTRVIAPDIEKMDAVLQSIQSGGQLLMPRMEIIKEKAVAREEYMDLQQRIEALNIQIAGDTAGPIPYPSRIDQFPVRVYYSSIHTREEKLQERLMKHPGFTYMFITAFEDWSEDGRRNFFGLVRPMRDPQKYANKFLSQGLHIYTSNPKGGVMAEMDMFEDVTQAGKEWNKANAFIPVKAGTLSNAPHPKFVQLTSAPFPRGLETMLSYSMSAVAASVGISEASFLGQAGDIRRVSGEALSSLISQQQKTQVLPFDSLRLYRRTMGRLMLSFIQQDFDEHLLSRLLSNPDDQLFIQTYREGALLDEYDVVVEEAPTSPNERQQIFQVLVESNILPQFMTNGIPIPPSLAEYFPLPSLATSELKRSLELVYQLQMANIEMQLMALLNPAAPQPGQPPQGGEGGAPPSQGE